MTPNGTAQESSLLLTLAEISKLVAHCHDPGETLANIVNLIQGRFHTDVCSVYLFEPAQGELVLGATVGLRPESIGRVRMRVDEGLTGLVAQELAPVMVEDAFRHPRFKYFPEAGEDPYHSFLGVPLVEGGVLQGVLVVQTVEPRPFSSNEVRMLVTVASQLAPLISGAQLLERLLTVGHDRGSSSLVPTEPGPPSFLRGVSLSPGRGQGEVYVVNFPGELLPSQRNGVTDPAQECSRLNQAMTAAAEEITRLSQRVSDLIGQDNGAILQAQLLMLQDRTIEHDLTDCLKAGQTAEEALHHTLDKYVALFQGTITGYLQERIQDVKDVFRRIHWHLRPRPAASSAGRRLVLIGPEASVMDLFSVDLDNLAAVVVESGGVHSHAAILARSLGIPMVGQVPGALRHLQTGQKLDVDGSAGMVYLDPPAEAGVLPPVTNGERPGPEAQTSEVFSLGGPHLEANINLLSEVQQAIAWQVAGVGLFRSEFLFLARRTLPTEEEQVGLYRKLLARLGGRPASLRTFDLRPDKLPHGRSLTSSSDGPLDWRRVLGSPLVQKLFKEQVRAILRAAARGPARLLVPLVLCTEQLDWILGTLEEARKELQGEGLEYCPKVPLGIMIEVAGVVPLVEAWADYVDFFTLGTNDLVSSALGIPRDDSGSNPAHDPLHPGVLRLIREATTAARRAGKPVTVCGEMAADPAGATVLAAFQVDALSVAVNQLPATRSVLNALPHQVPEDLVPSFLSLRTAAEVRRLLRDWTRELLVQHDHFISDL